MSISQDSVSTVVCREVFDENSQPSEKEVLDHARKLGIDPDNEPQLLELAREGLMAALPKGWIPVYDENTNTHYYYQRKTNTTTWEHPIDAVYRDLIAQARATANPTNPIAIAVASSSSSSSSSNRRRASVGEDLPSEAEAVRGTKTLSLTAVATAAVAASRWDLPRPATAGLPPPVPQQLKSPSTRIPKKLAPLKRHRSESTSGFPRRSESSLDRLTRAWKSGDSEVESISTKSSLSSDRVARDYTNLRFQDPEFYESPRVIETAKQKLDLRDVLRRSESLSPRHEKDWKQLNSRFSSEENIIDIDHLSVTSLGTKPRTPDTSLSKAAADVPSSVGQKPQLQEQQQCNQQQPKELILSGGGSIFLKSNRSRDTTPCHDEVKTFPDQQQPGTSGLSVPSGSNEDMNASCGSDRLKSILRDKISEDDDRHMDEERKSVRFDLQKVAILNSSVTKFNDSESEKEDTDEDSEPDERVDRLSTALAEKRAAAVLSLQKVLNRQSTDSEGSGSFGKKAEIESKSSKVVARRFVVENVTEKEHQLQQQRNKSADTDDECANGKFENIKHIDLVSKSDSERNTLRSSGDSRSNFLDELRKSKDIMLENMKKSEIRAKIKEEEESRSGTWSSKILKSLELSKEGKCPANSALMLEVVKTNLIKVHEQDMKMFKQELEEKLEETKRYLESEFNDQKLSLEASLQERLSELKKEMADKEEKEIQKLVADMDVIRAENLKKVRSELEICYEKERQDILANLKIELDQRKRELLELRSQEISKLESEHEKGLDDERHVKLGEIEVTKQHGEKIENLKKELDKDFNNVRADLRNQQREKIMKIKDDHEKCLADILRDFKTDEAITRKMYKQRLDEIRADHAKDIENEIKKLNDSANRQENGDCDKLRYEKRLVEDKYNILKEKYLKLKKDMRAAIEKRNRRKELANATASETEMSTSTRTRTDRTESSDQKSPLTKTNSISNSKSKEIPGQNPDVLRDQPRQQQSAAQQRVIVKSSIAPMTNQVSTPTSPTIPDMVQQAPKSQKFESDDTTTCSETTSNLLMNKRKRVFTKKQPNAGANKMNNNTLADNPVENIRKQLEKLEDLGDQLPSNDTAYTVRYPFQDKSPTNVSSELEFFKHRIHLERDFVKRAREALRQQRSAFQSRQRAWKQRSSRATLDQIVKEERELSDMEVSLHRTRSLLGEKVIHLRHLEQSLERVANARRSENEANAAAIGGGANKSDELTLSDMSSASSGFSSTDLGTDIIETTEKIAASLETLNSEIREIWGVLNKRQESGVMASMPPLPPAALMYTDLSWYPYQHQLTSQPSAGAAAFGTPNIQSNILSQLTGSHPPSGTTQNIIAQYGPTSGYTTSVGTVEQMPAGSGNLIERTRNLKDWLRQARIETSDHVSPGQATL